MPSQRNASHCGIDEAKALILGKTKVPEVLHSALCLHPSYAARCGCGHGPMRFPFL